ncbi:MAG: type II toxin-antitoxin system prevent-host-death family antitoxin [Solirubrobacterales bacterium]|nr:type II toxin-antitoxin system prevent-host-death family antitoxin [Solirubrobacterales bacterium]
MADAISISEAKTNLSKLVARAERGEDVVIRRGATAVVRLVPVSDPPARPRSPVGALRGRIVIADDADELGPEWDPYR